MTKEKFIDHIISRLEPQILDYVEQVNWRETRGNNRYEDNSRPRREFNRFVSQGVADNQRFDGRRRGGQLDHRFHNQGGLQGGSRNSAFRDTEHQTIRVSSLRMTPVDLTCIPILLNETFITALWNTGEEQSFISEEVYANIFRIDLVKRRKKILLEGKIRPIQSPYTSPVVLTRKNNGLPPDSPASTSLDHGSKLRGPSPKALV
ncbi:uncharacterized protein TNCV_2933551 [Trichonephila clavipes]|nr:uncharacterized protein TNCV_2933551 [Trichonephila clavipes]